MEAKAEARRSRGFDNRNFQGNEHGVQIKAYEEEEERDERGQEAEEEEVPVRTAG